jgi:hypothetical protein
MPSQPVLDALDKLHQQLEQLQPAISHIEAARSVTEQAKTLPPLQKQFLDNLKKSDEEHKEGLTNIFQQKIERLSANHQQITKTTEDLQQVISGKVQKIADLITNITSFYVRVEQIDFPERLSNIESTVKQSVIQIEESRKVMADEVGRLNDNIGQVDFQGDFKELKTIVQKTADDNANYIKVFKDENIASKLEVLSKKIVQIPGQIDVAKVDLSSQISTTIEKSKVSVHNKIENLTAEFQKADHLAKFSKIQTGIDELRDKYLEWIDLFKRLQLQERLDLLSNQLVDQKQQFDSFSELMIKQANALDQKLDHQHKLLHGKMTLFMIIVVMATILILTMIFLK